MSERLDIGVSFPHGVYQGAVLGMPEDIPEPARVHEALVAAAAGGSRAAADGRVLVACDEDRQALEWLEATEPLGIVIPAARATARSARRYRWRASPVAPADTDFEPFSALAGPVIYQWPPAPPRILTALQQIAAEVTHVGRADSIAVVRVSQGSAEHAGRRHEIADGRGAGRVMRVARRGRMAVLTRAHADAARPGRHTTGPMGKQAPDLLVTGANETALELRRFAPVGHAGDWPYGEVWQLRLASANDAWLWPVERRVAAAIGIHRALVRAIGDDVPALVTGRDGDAPLQGSGHLAVHVAPDEAASHLVAYLAVPTQAVDADVERLAAALRQPIRAGARVGHRHQHWFTVADPIRRSAAPFWSEPGTVFRTAVPMIVEINGGPRRGNWTLDDAVMCSVGFAMRGVLERAGLAWGRGWAFRQALVDHLRDERGVQVRADRVHHRSAPYLHRAAERQLVVAANALVDLGDLGRGFLALGRARHLGGGLLVPQGRRA